MVPDLDHRKHAAISMLPKGPCPSSSAGCFAVRTCAATSTASRVAPTGTSTVVFGHWPAGGIRPPSVAVTVNMPPISMLPKGPLPTIRFREQF